MAQSIKRVWARINGNSVLRDEELESLQKESTAGTFNLRNSSP